MLVATLTILMIQVRSFSTMFMVFATAPLGLVGAVPTLLLFHVAAMLALISLTHSTFWGALAYVLIGGVGVGTLLTLLFLPALYALWFRVTRETSVRRATGTSTPGLPLVAAA